MIRRARRADLDRLLGIEQQSFASDRIARRSMRRFLGRPTAQIWVSEHGPHLAGYILILRHARRRAARLYSLATAPDYAGQGIARALMAHAEQQCGAPSLTLEVRADNVRAQALYRAADYGVIGERPAFYQDGQSALIMKKDLGLK